MQTWSLSLSLQYMHKFSSQFEQKEVRELYVVAIALHKRQ